MMTWWETTTTSSKFDPELVLSLTGFFLLHSLCGVNVQGGELDWIAINPLTQ